MSHLESKKNGIYGNYNVYSPDGHLMFRCNFKKVNWYLKRNLAEFLDKKTIILKFKPNGLGNHNKKYGLQEMENKCVVCGEENNLTKHHVVPISYRKYFPIEIKSHNFHDVLTMCVDCHENYEKKADIYKKYLSEKYNAPISGINNDKEYLSIRKMANCILNYSDILPKIKLFEIKNNLKTKLGIKRLHNKRLSNILNFKNKIKTHGEIVVDNVDIKDFIISWRKHFIENNNCGFLPKEWSIYNE